MDIPFHSNEAKEINKKIFETMYHAALETSMEVSTQQKKEVVFLMKVLKGLLQVKVFYNLTCGTLEPSNRYNWGKLKMNIIKNGY